MFDFESPGTGKYTFEPVTTFQIIDDDAKPNAFKVSATSVEVNVMDDVALAPGLSFLTFDPPILVYKS